MYDDNMVDMDKRFHFYGKIKFAYITYYLHVMLFQLSSLIAIYNKRPHFSLGIKDICVLIVLHPIRKENRRQTNIINIPIN